MTLITSMEALIETAERALFKMFPEATSVGVTRESMLHPHGRRVVGWQVWVGVKGGPNIIETDGELLVAMQNAMTRGTAEELRVAKVALRELMPAEAFS